jgi:DNA-binding response OmpR family regulator
MTAFTLHKLNLTGPSSSVRLTRSEAELLKAFTKATNAQLNFAALDKLLSTHLSDTSAKAALQVRMVRLRKKMHACGAEGSVIESIRNVGYQLFEPIDIQ